MRYLTWEECLKEKPFAAVVDVRSPAEYAENHIPGAVNLPVLDNAERAEVGTLYCQVSRFDARRLGAAMVARNAARHLESFFAPWPEHARFLLYCWRGGQRSRALATILHAVGWNITVISGGYKNYRAWVREGLKRVAPQLQCRILTGLTGSGKSRLLRRMAEAGHQVLDLEALGCHRGSLLGMEPGRPQPSQKHFESLLLQAMERFDLSRPVWVESESKRLGRLWIPEELWQAMMRAPVHQLQVPREARARFLAGDYRHFIEAPDSLLAMLPVLKEACGGRTLQRWEELIRAGQWEAFTDSILELHYDPVYCRCSDYAAPAFTHAMPAMEDAAMDAVINEMTGTTR